MADIAYLELALGVALGLAAILPLVLYLLREWKKIIADGKIEPAEILALLTGGQKLIEETKEDVEEALEKAEELAEAVESGEKDALEVVEEVAEEVTLSKRRSKRKFSNSKRVLSKAKAKASKVARLNKKIKSLKSKLSRKPANTPLNVNKFSSNRSHTVSAKDYGQMTRREKFLHDLNK